MLTRDDLIEIAERYHREDWGGFQPTMAVFDIGRLMGHISIQAERLAALEAAAQSVIDACHPGKQHMPWTQLAVLATLLKGEPDGT